MQFSGSIKSDSYCYSVDFEVYSGEDFVLQFDLKNISFEAAIQLKSMLVRPGQFVEEFILEGTADAGETFYSDSVSVTRVQIGANNAKLDITTRKARITLKTDELIHQPSASLLLRGFRCSPFLQATNTLGIIKVCGSPTKTDPNKVTGCIAIQADKDVNLQNWKQEVDDFLTFMACGLSFARGARLATPRLDFHFDNILELTYYSANTSSVGLSTVHSLMLEEFVIALSNRFISSKPFNDKLWTAVGWLHNDSSVDEGRFLMSMTALESVVEILLPEIKTTVIPKSDYKPIKSKLIESLSTADICPETKDIFSSRIQEMNRVTFSQKIKLLRDTYGLPTDTYSDTLILDVVKNRNKIIHSGSDMQNGELWEKILFVRDFIAQVMFAEFGYRGHYEKYTGEYETVYPQNLDVDQSNPTHYTE